MAKGILTWKTGNVISPGNRVGGYLRKTKTMEDYELFELTPEQKKVFKRLNRAYNDCKKAGISFSNLYGDLTAYDSAKIRDIGDESSGHNGIPYKHNSGYKISIPQEWCDDDMFVYKTNI